MRTNRLLLAAVLALAALVLPLDGPLGLAQMVCAALAGTSLGAALWPAPVSLERRWSRWLAHTRAVQATALRDAETIIVPGGFTPLGR